MKKIIALIAIIMALAIGASVIAIAEQANTEAAAEVVAEEAYFADSKREPGAANFEAGFNASVQPTETPTSEGFMAIEEDSNLPF